MKTFDNDILASRSELKKMPFGVPEGYFDAFKADISKTSGQRQSPTSWKKSVPYMAAAACLALLATVGTIAITRAGQHDPYTLEDYILLSDNLISTTLYEESEQMAAAEMLEEDIIEYLIYIGVSPETIELSK